MGNPIRTRLNAHAKRGMSQIEARCDNLYAVYSGARIRLEDKLKQYVLSGNNSLTGPRLVALVEELQDEFALFEERYREEAGEAIPYICQSFYRSALTDLAANGTKTISGGLDKEQIRLAVEDSYTHIAGATDKMRDTAIYNLRRISAQVMRESKLTGETAAAVSRRLYLANNADGAFLFRDRGGKAWNSNAYFRMLGRTLLHNNARESYLTGCTESGHDIVTIPPSGDPCPACAKLEGRLYSITGKTPGLMTVQEAIDAGMMHPNCTHRFVAVPPEIAGAKYEADGTPRKTGAAPQFALGDGKQDGFYAKGFTDAADREQHETAERAVRSVHALTGMPPVQIMRAKEHPFQPKAHGMTLRDPKTGYAERIEIYDASPNKAFTEVHEMGHAIDDFLGISSSATGRRLLNLLERTEPFYQVCEYEDRVRSWVDSNTKSAALTAINYFLRPDEQFARAYAQYIAEKSKNRILLAQLEKQDILSKWNDDDFREVRKEFDAILKLAGWIK